MNWRKKEKNGVAAVTQLRSGQVHPFGALRGYVPLGTGEEQIYYQMRTAIPVLDAAVGKLVRLSGGFEVKCRNQMAQEKLNQFLKTVPCGLVGADTRKVLADLGYSEKQIEAMIAAGAAV